MKRTAAFFLTIQNDPEDNTRTNREEQKEQSATRSAGQRHDK